LSVNIINCVGLRMSLSDTCLTCTKPWVQSPALQNKLIKIKQPSPIGLLTISHLFFYHGKIYITKK
jgi:hypothetical protein